MIDVISNNRSAAQDKAGQKQKRPQVVTFRYRQDIKHEK